MREENLNYAEEKFSCEYLNMGGMFLRSAAFILCLMD